MADSSQSDRERELLELLREAGQVAAHAVSLGTVNRDLSSKGGEESDEVADLLRRIGEAVGEVPIG